MNVANELGRAFKEPVEIREDNEAVIAIIEGGRNTKMISHMDLKYNFVREQFDNGKFKLKYVGTADQIADFMTKPLGEDAFTKGRAQTGLVKGDSVDGKLHN